MLTTLKTLMISLYLLSPLLSYGQLLKPDEQVNRSGASKLIFADSLTQAIDYANADINEGTPFLLIKGGISPVVFASDAKFQEDYRIHYYNSSCTGPREQIAIEYNKVMFKCLTRT